MLTRAAAAATASLLLASCTGGDPEAGEEPTASPTPSVSVSPSPTSTVPVPAQVSLTDVGADLSFGDPATVIYEPNQKRGSVLELTVRGARKGSTQDLSAFVLDDDVKASTPYYVDVTVENVGEGDVGGTPVPLWGVDGTRTLLPPAVFTTRFNKCESEPLPKKFQPGDKVRTCLVYLAPQQGDLEAVSFRPNQEFDPIEWTGEVVTPKDEKKAGKKSGKKSGTKSGGDRSGKKSDRKSGGKKR